jgi:hypothetical protein
MRGHARALTQGAALLAGAALGVLALSGWTVQGGTQAPPADLTLTAMWSSVLDVQPAGTNAVARKELRVGSPALAGSVRLFNATGEPVSVRVRAHTEERELDRSVRLRVQLGAKTLFEGSLEQLELFGSRPFDLASHARTRVAVRAWIPGSAVGYEAWVVHVALRFATAPTERSS